MKSLLNKLLLFGFLCIAIQSNAQEVNFDLVVPPDNVRAASFEDYLVQVAWRNRPESKILQKKVNIAEFGVKAQKREWLNAFNANFGFNSVKDTITFFQNRYLGPGYNYGLSLSLGHLFTNGPKVKMAEEKVEIENFNLKTEKLSIRREVLQRYHKYLLAIETLKARQQAEEDAFANYQLISELFKKNRADFDEANKASITYHDTKEKRLAAETEIAITKLELEEMLGVKWEQVSKYKERYGGG